MKLRKIVKIINIGNGGNGSMMSVSRDLQIPYHKVRDVLNEKDAFTEDLYTKLIDVYNVSEYTKAELKKFITNNLDKRMMNGFEGGCDKNSYLIPPFEDFAISLLKRKRRNGKVLTLEYFAEVIRTPLKKVESVASGEDILNNRMIKRILNTFEIDEFDKMIMFHYSREDQERRATSEVGPLIVFLNDALRYNRINKTQFDKMLDILLPTKSQEIENKLEETMNKLDISTMTLLTRIEKCREQEILKPLLVMLYNINYPVFSEVIQEDKFKYGYEREDGNIVPWKDEIIGDDLALHDHLSTTDWMTYCVKAIGLADENINK